MSKLKHEMNAAMSRRDEDRIVVKAEDVAYGNEVKDAVVSVIYNLDQDLANTTATRKQLWVVCGVLQRKVDQVLACIRDEFATLTD